MFAVIALCIVSAPAEAAVVPANTTAILSGESSLFDEFSAPIDFSTSSRQAVSQDGRFVTFASESDGLSDQDDDSVENIYVKDSATGAVTVVSRRTDGTTSHASCAQPVISDDGNRVAFVCFGPLDPADTNNTADVYVHDLTTNQTILVSRLSGDGAVGDGDSRTPSINQDGTKIAFSSSAPSLTGGHGLQVFVGNTTAHTTTLVSSPTGTNDAPNGQAELDPSISDDGNEVAFSSSSSNLVGGDNNNAADVFVRNMSTGDIALASRASGAGGAIGDRLSEDPQISGDGSTVAFSSSATNLVPTLDSDTTTDVYKRTLTGTPTTMLVDLKGTTKSDHGADSPALNDTGTVIAFHSFATNFDPAVPSPDGLGEIYASSNGGAPVLVSRGTGPAGAPSSDATNASVSGDGQWIGFESRTSVTGDDLFDVGTANLRSLSGQSTAMVSRPPGTDPLVNLAGDSFDGAVSADGHFVAFESNSRGVGVPAGIDSAVVVRNTLTGAVTITSRADGPGGAVMANAFSPSISADGSRVAFEVSPERNVGDQIWVRDLNTGQTIRVDRADGANGDVSNDDSEEPSIDAAGDKVAYESDSTNLSPDDKDAHDDIYVRDIVHSTTTLASRAVNGDKGDDESFSASLSADGDHVAFGSFSDNLGDGDTDKTEDIHVRDLSAGITRLASVSSDGQKGNRESDNPSLSADGSRVAFDGESTNFGSTQGDLSEVWVHDFASGKTLGASRADGPGGDFLSTSSLSPFLSADGRVVAFSSGAGFVLPGMRRAVSRGVLAEDFTVYRRDLAAGTTSLVSRGQGADGTAATSGFGTGISSDGACVAFDASGGLVSPAVGAEDYSQVYMRTFGPNCAAPATGTPAKDTTAPVLRSVKLTHSRFRVARGATVIAARKIPRGTQLRFTSSEAAKLTIVIQRQVPGRNARKGKKRVCRPVHKRPKHGACKALRRRATLTRHIKAGSGRVSLTGRIVKRRMTPDRYRLTITATDAAGNRSKAIHRSFTILAG